MTDVQAVIARLADKQCREAEIIADHTATTDTTGR